MRLRTVSTWCLTLGVFVGFAFEHFHHGGLYFALGSLLASIGLTIVWIVQRRTVAS